MQPFVPPSHKSHYQEILLDIAKSMVRLKRPERLLKMITRYIDKQHHVTHTAILLLREDQDAYTFVDSKGTSRIPPRLVKFEIDHPLVHWFKVEKMKGRIRRDFLTHSFLVAKLSDPHSRLPEGIRREMKAVKRAMETFKVHLVIPGYYKHSLLGLLLLGNKKDGQFFTDAEISFFQILTQDCSMAVKTSEYHRGLLEKNKELERRLKEIELLRAKEQKTYYEIMRSLAQEVYAKDVYTFGHISQVEQLGLLTAEELGVDLGGRKRAVLSAGLLLHDVGKIGIADTILNKPSRLNHAEWEEMKRHVEKGIKILEPLTDFQEAVEIIRHHHENYDGSGYPNGLRGEEIPVESRIVAVVDAFHAIITNRCYSLGKSVTEAFEELRRCAGTQFDPKVVEAFVKVMKSSLKKGTVRGLAAVS